MRAPRLPLQPAPLRIGVFFWHESANDELAFAGVRKAFATRGVAHAFDVRRAGGDEGRARGFLDAWRARGTDLVLALGTRAAHLSQGRLGATPIVFAAVTNPIESGLVASWGPRFRRSSTLVRQTGTSNWIRPEIVLKVFRLACPNLRRLGVLRSATAGYVSAVELRGLRAAAARESRAPGAPPLEFVESIFERRIGLEKTVARLLEAGVHAIWIPIDHGIYKNSAQILDAVAGRGVPLLSSSLRATRDAAVAGIFVDYELLGQRAAAQAMRILIDGESPEHMPVETMKSYQIVVNRTAARRCGYELPLPLLAVAERVLPEKRREGGR